MQDVCCLFTIKKPPHINEGFLISCNRHGGKSGSVGKMNLFSANVSSEGKNEW
jgi:hypothetical protein